MLLKDLLATKSQVDIITIRPQATVLAAMQTMCEHKVGALLVQEGDNSPVGIISERDVLRYSAYHAAYLEETKVEGVMTKDLIVATLEMDIDHAMHLMTENKFRHLPIVDGHKVITMISIGDLVKAQLTETSVEAKYLRDYITLV